MRHYYTFAKDRPIIHSVSFFVGGRARTRCGRRVANDRVTADRKQVTCKVCKGRTP